MSWNRRKQQHQGITRNRFSFETLEDRRLLTVDFAPDLFVPETPDEQAIADEVGYDLAWLYTDYLDWLDAGGAASEPFSTFSPAYVQLGFAVEDLQVSIEAYAETDAASVRDTLLSFGFEELASYGRGLTGWLPLASIDDLSAVEGLLFARLAHGSVTNVGSTDTQGDAAQRSDDARTMFGVDGTGVTVGVISDSYDVSASAGGSAAQDVMSNDLPAEVNVLDDTRNPNQVIDEGRAMLQIVHDVAPGAGLAFHTAGISQIAMAAAIGDLETAGSDVIVDDVIFFAEPMFQDGVIAQAVDDVVANGVSYFSSAGNQARRSYESGFNAGQQLNIGGVLETAHEFDPGTNDIFQRVTIPIGNIFRVSFQWDAPAASAGGAGANNNLNIYLIQGGNTIVAQGRTNNIGGDAVEILSFANTTLVNQFDILITSAGGPLPGLMKYVDFGTGITFNEYLTNSSTSFGHSNANGAVSLGAASFLDTPEFGTTPPVVENFSSLGGTPILFNLAGVRLVTPEVREKVDLVGPDGGNTTFFGTDIAGDADAFPNFFGTSAAAPHVAALAALMLQTNPNLTVPQITQILDATAIDMDNPFVGGFQTGFDPATGLGLVDGVAAVDTTLGTRGDFDRDQDVDGRDFLIWQRSFGATANPVGTGADGDLSGTVGSGDLTIWQNNYGQSIPTPLVAASTAAIGSEESTSGLSERLPNNFFIKLFPDVGVSLENSLADIDSIELDNPTVKESVFASLDLPTNQRSQESEFYLGSDKEDSRLDEAIDQVFQSIEDELLIAFA